MFVQESPFSEQILTLSKPLGRDIALRVGEIIEGEVVDLFPGGGITLKIKGGYLPARTGLPVSRNEILLLKVLGKGGKGGEVILQLVEGQEKSTGSQAPATTVLLEEGGRSVSSDNRELFQVLEGWLKTVKTIPSDPEKIRVLLGEVLKVISKNNLLLTEKTRFDILRFLRNTITEGLPETAGKILSILDRLPEGWLEGIYPERLKEIYPSSMRGLTGGILKELLEQSGVLLEAKVHALVRDEQVEGSGVPISKNKKIINDFKYILLKLKSIVDQKTAFKDSMGLLDKWMENSARGKQEGDYVSLRRMAVEINDLLKEVETFQVLSKVSEAFFTFLPIPWEGLKRGELVFKKKKRSDAHLFSCGIHLDLERVGEVSAWLLMQRNDFFIYFKVEDPSLKTLILSGSAELKEAFQGHGLHLAHIAFEEKKDMDSDPLEAALTGETLVSIRV